MAFLSFGELTPVLQSLSQFVNLYNGLVISKGGSHAHVPDPEASAVWNKLYHKLGENFILEGVTYDTPHSGVFNQFNSLNDFFPPALREVTKFSQVSKIKHVFENQMLGRIQDRNTERFLLILYPVYILILHFVFRAFVMGVLTHPSYKEEVRDRLSAESGLSLPVCQMVVAFCNHLNACVVLREVDSFEITDKDIEYLLSMYQQLAKLWLRSESL